MAHAKKARAIGFNHVALEVGDIDEALAFYGRLFKFELRGRSGTSALSTWAISSWLFRRAAPSPPTTVGILDSLSMTRKPSAVHWRRRA
jgi:catechol 2,3-dioxygenase-like lactoylglutathione lyase family enzyme